MEKCISREGKESSCEDEQLRRSEQLRRRLLLKITSCRETSARDPSAKFDFAGFVISSFGFHQARNLAGTAQVDKL